MITIRQIERLFNLQRWPEMVCELLSSRPEGLILPNSDGAVLDPSRTRRRILADPLSASLARVVPVSAMAMIRLDELVQASHPLYRRLLNVILMSQEKDGGWSDPLTTSLCLRALLGGQGRGACIGLGLGYLANMQKAEGVWPREPIRRFPADPLVSAFLLHQLGEFGPFREAVRVEEAIQWFQTHASDLDEPTARLWSHARIRCRSFGDRRPALSLWSAARPAAYAA